MDSRRIEVRCDVLLWLREILKSLCRNEPGPAQVDSPQPIAKLDSSSTLFVHDLYPTKAIIVFLTLGGNKFTFFTSAG